MGLEAGNGFITGLVATNPVGATDPKSQGDDHLRLIKAALLGSFPNIGGAVTLTHTQINEAARLSVANVFTAVQQITASGASVILRDTGGGSNQKQVAIASGAGNFAITSYTDAGAPQDNALVAHRNTSGNFDTLALTATAITLNGVAATDFARLSQANIFAAQLTLANAGALVIKSGTTGAGINNYISFQDSGSVERAYVGFGIGASSIFSVRNTVAGAELRLSSNGGSITLDGVAATDFARLSQSNTFTGATQTLSNASPSLTINETDGNNTAPVQFQNAGNPRATIGSAHAASAVIAGTADGDFAISLVNGGLFFSGNNGATAHLKLSNAGVVTTPNASASEVGYKGTPPNTQNGNYTLVLADAGGLIAKQSGAGNTLTIPANGSVAFPIGTIITIDNDSGNAVSIAITTDVLELAGTGATGTRTLSDNGSCSIQKIAATKWRIAGTGVS